MSLRIVINDHDYERIIGLSLDFFGGNLLLLLRYSHILVNVPILNSD